MEADNALVFDRHPLVRDTLKSLLKERGFTVFGTGSDTELIKMASDNKPAIITVDISSSVNAIESLIRRLIQATPTSKILVVTSLPTEHYSSCCMTAGASGLISKKARMSCLNAAIDAVIHDYIFFPAKDLLLISAGAVSFKGKTPESIACLSNREKDVMYKILQEKTLTQVAEELGVSVKTISTYKSRLFRKLDVTNLVELSSLLNRVLYIDSKLQKCGLVTSNEKDVPQGENHGAKTTAV